MKKKSTIMVALSAAVIAPAAPIGALAQVVVTCPVIFRLGNIVNCAQNGSIIIDPNGNLKSTVSCVYITNAPQPAVCTVETGGNPVSKSVKVVFDSPTALIQNGGDSFLLDRLRMSYNGAPTPATKITLTAGQVAGGGVTVKVGGRIHPVSGLTLGQYMGEIIINADIF